MGLTFSDIQNMSREATALYPPRRLPVFTQPSEEEKQVAQLQLGFANRLKSSPYYISDESVPSESHRFDSTELPRYSDKYRPSAASHSTLKRSMLHAPFFPAEILDDYFNPRRKRKMTKRMAKRRLNLDEVGKEDDAEKSGEEQQSNAGSEEVQSDYDVDEEYDNDYAENYFDNGEGDDMDNLGDAGLGDDGGGGGKKHRLVLLIISCFSPFQVMTTSEYIQLYTSLLNPSNRSAFYFPRPVEPGCSRAS
ncbi:DNA-directed RNA polymerase III subunit Rpc31 domain containing protein [Amanita muscaria]